MSQIPIRRDQSALYTTTAKCSLYSWHFWVRRHFTAVFSLTCQKKREQGWDENSERDATQGEGWRGFSLRVITKSARTCAHLLSRHSRWVSHLLVALVLSFLHNESLSDTWASAGPIQLLDWPPDVHMEMMSNSRARKQPISCNFSPLPLTQPLTAG